MAIRSWLVLLGGSLACNGDNALTEPMEADTEADSDADSDADADADADADTDSDSDADTAADMGCGDAVLFGPIPLSVDGSTVGAGNNIDASCGGWQAHDYAYEFTAPNDALYVFDTAGSPYDTVLYVYDGCASQTELACDDDSAGNTNSRVLLELAAGQTVIVVVDGYFNYNGPFTLNVAEAPTAETACDDGIDEDFDFLADCLDADCAGVGGCVPRCPDLAFGPPPSVVVGSTQGLLDEAVGSCSYGGLSPDASIEFVAPADGRYAFRLTENTDLRAVLYALDGCGGPELGCSPPFAYSPFGDFVGNQLALDLVQDQTVVVVVDGLIDDAGDFEIEAFEVPGTEIGYCGDQADNDFDLAPDCYDPDCQDEPACIEDCASGLDEDVDGLTDCVDPECAGNIHCVEVCPEEELVGALPLQALGSTLGAADDFQGTCTFLGGSDTTYRFTAPSDGTYYFDTYGSYTNTVLYVLDGTCAGAELGCNDNSFPPFSYYYSLQSEVVLYLTANQTVTVVVDSPDPYSGGPFVLNVHQ